MAREESAETADRIRVRIDRRALVRLALGFAAGLAFWVAFPAPYERTVAAAAEFLLRTFEHPAVTRLSVSAGEFRVDRADFPPSSPRPGLPAADLHFNFVLLCALFALSPRPLSPGNFGRFWAAAAALWAIHVLALVLQVESLYATRLGPWSQAHYGPVARNLWAGGFHFYQIAGRFAAPFVLWWGLGRPK
ncbi:MAG: hypothetical protein WAU32_11305 [Thermoanaerobaculia bacterium]